MIDLIHSIVLLLLAVVVLKNSKTISHVIEHLNSITSSTHYSIEHLNEIQKLNRESARMMIDDTQQKLKELSDDIASRN